MKRRELITVLGGSARADARRRQESMLLPCMPEPSNIPWTPDTLPAL